VEGIPKRIGLEAFVIFFEFCTARGIDAARKAEILAIW
jgi:hypothetical protein